MSNGSQSQNADTYNWDSAFTVKYPTVNQALKDAWPNLSTSIKSFNQSEDSYTIQGTFGPWQVAGGGSGDLVQLTCPITSGTMTGPGISGNGLGLDGCVAVIQVRMQWIPNPDQQAFVISGDDVATIQQALSSSTPSVPSQLSGAFASNKVPLVAPVTVTVRYQNPKGVDQEWSLLDASNNSYFLFQTSDKYTNKYINVYQYKAEWANQLTTMANALSDELPAVVLQNILNNPLSGIQGDIFQGLLSDWFNSNIWDFDYIFASLNVATQLDSTAQWAWITPTSTSYAVVDDNTMDGSVFGVLTMDQNDTEPGTQQVSPNSIPQGADAGFLISGPQFVRNMILQGATAVFDGSGVADFTITNDGLTVQNTNQMVWGNFVIDDNPIFTVSGDFTSQLQQQQLPSAVSQAFTNNDIYLSNNVSVSTSSPGGNRWLLSDSGNNVRYALEQDQGQLSVYNSVQLTIPAGQFQLTLQETFLQIQFIDLEYPYSDDYNVHVNYTEQVTLGLKQEDGKNIFWFTQAMKSMQVSVTKTKTEITTEIVLGAVTAVLSLLAVVGPLLEGLASVGEVTEGVGEGFFDLSTGETLNIEEENPSELEESEDEAGENAGKTLKGDKWSSIKNAFRQPRWKIVGALAGIAGGITGLEQIGAAIEEAAATNQWENVPGFDQFANLCIQPYAWTGVQGFVLNSAQLAGSLQIGLKLQSSTN